VIRQHEVAIAEITHDLPLSTCEYLVAARLTSPYVLGKIEKTDTAVRLHQLRDNLARRLRESVSDDENFQIPNGLGENASD
jgi:hypothetical protein